MCEYCGDPDANMVIGNQEVLRDYVGAAFPKGSLGIYAVRGHVTVHPGCGCPFCQIPLMYGDDDMVVAVDLLVESTTPEDALLVAMKLLGINKTAACLYTDHLRVQFVDDLPEAVKMRRQGYPCLFELAAA